MGSPQKPLLMRMEEGRRQDAFMPASMHPQLSPFFQAPPLDAPFLPPMPLTDAIGTGPQLPITLERALEVVGAAVSNNLGADSSFYFVWAEFKQSLLALVAARRAERAKELAEKISAAIEEGRAVRADVAALEKEHNVALMAWNESESAASAAGVKLAAVLASDPAARDEFAREADHQAWLSTVGPAEQMADEARKLASNRLQDMHVLEERISARKRDLDKVRQRLHALREEL